VNLAQIHSAVPEIFHTETKNNQRKDVLPNINSMQAAPFKMHWNVLHAADGTILSLLGAMGVLSTFLGDRL